MVYKRKFIILKNDYQKTHGNAKGHSKLEMKGIRGLVTLNIENAERENYYNVTLLADDKKSSIWNLGKIFTDDTGRGKGEYPFIQRELETNNFPLSRLSAIVILKDNEVLLGGYVDKDDNSIDRYINTLSDLQTSSTQYEAESKENDIKIEDEVDFEIEDSDDLQNDNIGDTGKAETYTEEYTEEDIETYTEEDTEEDIETYTEEDTEDKAYDVFYDSDISEADEEQTQESKGLEHIKQINRKNQTTMYVLSILRFFPYIDPFEYNLKGFNWWIVEMDKQNDYKSFLPYFSHITGGNKKDTYSDGITCNDLMVKYKHYLFGLYNENEKVKYYVYGIPGKFSVEEHPNGGNGGFNTWYRGKDELGYWLVYIDPMIGKPVYPEVPMIPAK